jgi:hypothetical protein
MKKAVWINAHDYNPSSMARFSPAAMWLATPSLTTGYEQSPLHPCVKARARPG